jgi:citrate lyase synthetase
MIKQGVKHLKNVVVIPSGKFMISAVTLSEAISASRVRKYLKRKEWEKIKEIVPDTTYEYLRMGKYE